MPCGKHPHKTRAKAMKHLKRNRQSKSYDGMVYYCADCDAFHVGRAEPWRKTEANERKRVTERIFS